MTGHARPGLAGRLAGLLRRRQPDLYPMRTVDYGDGPKIIGFWNEQPAGPGLAYGAGNDHPRWDDEHAAEVIDAIGNIEEAIERDTGRHPAPAPAAPPWPASAPYADSAGAYITQGSADHSLWYGLTRFDLPPVQARQYVPEPEPEPEPTAAPATGPGLVSYPPRRPLAADYRDLPMFRAVTRGACRAGLTGLGIRGGGFPVPAPDYARPLRALHSDMRVQADAAEHAFVDRYLTGTGAAA